jgi:uncharacterized protein
MTHDATPYLPGELARLDGAALEAGFFAAADEGGLAIQCCSQCQLLQHPPLEMCARCHSMDFDWQPMSGRGTVFTYTIAHHPIGLLKDYVPYNVVSVSLDEAPDIRIISNLIDVSAEDLRVGLPVRVIWEQTTAEVRLPRFRLAEENAHA